MKRNLGFFQISVRLLALLAVIAAIPAAAQDTTPPVLTGFTYSPMAVNTTTSAATVNVTAQVTDDLSGVGYVTMLFISPSRQYAQNAYMYLSSGSDLDGTWTGTVTIPAYSEAGTWTVEGVEVGDFSNNYLWYYTSDLQALGFPTTLQVTSNQDSTPPVLTGFTYSPMAVNTTTSAATVNVTAQVTDDLSGVGYVTMLFISPSRQYAQNAYMYLSSGSDLDGTWTGTVTIPAYSEAGTWTVEGVEVGDFANNYLWYYTSDLQALGFPTTLQVTSNQDSTPPVLTGFTYSPMAVNTTTSAATVNVTAQVTDDLSGVGYVTMLFISPSRQYAQNAYMYLSSGSDLDGTWTGTVTIPAYSEAGTWTVEGVEVGDFANNYLWYYTSDLQTLGFPTQLINNIPSTTTAVTSSSNPSIYGQSVTFTATVAPQGPGSPTGSVTFSDGATTLGVSPLTAGIATISTASLAVGFHTITAVYSGDSNFLGSTGSLYQTVNSGTQTITFTTNAPASAAYNTSFTVAATASSGLAVTFTSSGSCSNVGATYTMTSGSATCSVIANQAGNSNYSAATPVTQTTNATQASQTITFTTPAPALAGFNSSFTVTATASSGLAVTYTSAGACSNSGATYTITAPTGTCTVTASQSGNSNYLAAASVNELTTAKKGTQTVTFTGAPPTAVYQSSFTVATSQTSGITPTITASSACSIAGDIVTMLTGTGTCTLTARWAANTDYNQATVIQKTTAQKLTPSVTFTGAPATAAYLSTFTVATTQNSGITPTISSTTTSVCSVSGGVVTMKKGTGTCTVKASWAANSYYLAAIVTQTTTATLLGTTTTITSTVPQTNPLKVEVYFTATNGTSTAVTGNVTVTSAPGGETCTGSVTGGKCLLTFTAAGSQTLTAVYAGNTNDAISTSAPYSLTVQ